jgi:hypothetical protein
MEQQEKRKHRRRYQSLFWPMILVGVGTAWLLFNVGIFTASNIAVALQLWPLLLIIIGIDLIFGRKSPSRGATIGLAFVGLMLAVMYIGPSIGLGGNAERTNTTFDVPQDGTTALSLTIESGIESVTVNPLIDSNNLVEADLWHFGELDMDIFGDEAEKFVQIREKDHSFSFGLDFDNDETSGWAFNLNPATPLDLDFEGGVGHIEMNLESFNLSDLTLDMGVGSVDIALPSPQQSYGVDISGGVGQVIVDIPDDAEVRVIVSTGIGSTDLPSNLIQVEGEEEFVSAEGIWQTEGFEQAANTITINFDGGIGSLDIH